MKPTISGLVIATVLVVLFLVTGVAALGFPRVVQRLALRWCRPLNPFYGTIDTRLFVAMMRLVGAVAVTAGVFLAYLLLHSLD